MSLLGILKPSGDNFSKNGHGTPQKNNLHPFRYQATSGLDNAVPQTIVVGGSCDQTEANSEGTYVPRWKWKSKMLQKMTNAK